MPENTTNSPEADSAPQSQAHPYPARDADNGEEQRNRLGYMATEPTEDEIEGDENKSDAADADRAVTPGQTTKP